jgi:hypothetical protein
MKTTLVGWKSFKVYHIEQKGPSLYYNLFLPYILIPINNNESKIVNFFQKDYILDYYNFGFHRNNP